MTEQSGREGSAPPRKAAPRRVRLPGFIKDEEVGLVARVIRTEGTAF